MAANGIVSRFLSPRLRPQSNDIKSAVFWGVAATTTALWITQPFDWLKKTFLEKPEGEGQ